jgi:transposase
MTVAPLVEVSTQAKLGFPTHRSLAAHKREERGVCTSCIRYPRCCGLDSHKKTVVACVLLTDADGTSRRFVRTFGTMTADLLALSDWLQLHAVTQVAMESTGVLWRPVFNLLEEGRTLILVNAQHAKALPGRKTDVKDSEWLADLLRHGLLRSSFVPPHPIRVLRDLTRYRKSLVELRTQEINRVHKVLETANLKLGAVASNVVGASGRQMLRAIGAGESDPLVLADLAKGRLRDKLPALRLALAGRVQPHHRQLLGDLLDHIVYLEQAIHRLEVSLATRIAEQEETVQLLLTLPATGAVTAASIIAEIGTDMARFPSAKPLASWAGVCPGNRRSAGKQLSGATTKGNSHLKTILWEIAATIARSPGTYLHAFYQRLARRRAKPRAMLAVAHSLLGSIYYMLRDRVPYRDLGPDHFDHLHAQRLERHDVRRLEALGFQVQLSPVS